MQFQLQHPVTVNSTEYTELSAREPKVKDLRLFNNADKDPIGAMGKFIASICSIPPAVVDELNLVDFNTIQDWVQDFLPNREK